MTVGTQLKQTLAALKNSQSTIQAYALHHPNLQVKTQFSNCSKMMEEMILGLEERIKKIEFEEPQYKGY